MAKKKEVEAVEETAKVVSEEKVEAPKVAKFSKKQFVKSQRFAKQKDLVNALLKEEVEYSIKEVEDIVRNFLYGKK